MGPNFQKGSARIGRERLPSGIVAILDRPDILRIAFDEMLEFVGSGTVLDKGRAGIVFRVISAGERDALNMKFKKVCNDPNASCGNLLGYRHLLDVNHVAHILKRHTDPEAERRHGHIAVSKEDFYRIPEVVLPHNLVQCQITGDGIRLVYSREWEDGSLVVVEEVRPRRKELVVITLYKQK